MIELGMKTSNSLLQKYKSTINNCRKELVEEVAQKALEHVQEYGYGVGSGGGEPTGGAPIWRGPVTVQGHYAGYLSENHYVKKLGPYNAQIVSKADFTDGVIEGYSTNWFVKGEPIRFPPNYYHKRAVDKLYKEGSISTIWNNIITERSK